MATPESLLAASASLALTAPASAVLTSVAHTADEQAQSVRSGLLAGSSTGFSSAASSTHEVALGAAGQANESASAPRQAVVASSAASEEPLKTRAQAQSVAPRAAATEQNSAATVDPGLEATETLISATGAAHGLASSQKISQQSSSPSPAKTSMALPALEPGTSATAASGSANSPEISSSEISTLESSPVAVSISAAQSGQAAASSAIKSESTTTGSKGSDSSATRRVRGVGGLSSSGVQGTHLIEGESSGAAVDAGALTREVAGAHGAASAAAASTTGSSSAAATGTTAGETFAALDADTATGKPTWVHAGAQQAEAGFQDSSLGWVSVRADASGGGIHAALVAGSSEAAQALGGHMAGLNAYLAEHQTPVETLTLSSSGGGSSGSGWSGSGMDGSGSGQSAGQQGSGQQSGQETATAAVSISSSSTASTALAAAVSPSSAWSGRPDGSAYAATSAGTRISVVA